MAGRRQALSSRAAAAILADKEVVTETILKEILYESPPFTRAGAPAPYLNALRELGIVNLVTETGKYHLMLARRV